MYTDSLWTGIRLAYYVDSLYQGDMSFLPKWQFNMCKFVIPIYNFMFHPLHDFKCDNYSKEEWLFDDRYLIDAKAMNNRLKITNSNNTHICISIIQNKLSHATHKELDFDLANVENGNLKIEDLGNSRNFTTSEEVIEKIKLIQNCTMYFGSQCSWKNISNLYNKPCITIWMK